MQNLPDWIAYVTRLIFGGLMLGPIIDMAVPALQGIFSDSASQFSAGNLLTAPTITNLRRTNEEIQAVSNSAQTVEKVTKSGFEDMKQQIQRLSKDVQNKIDHNTANQYLAKVQTCM